MAQYLWPDFFNGDVELYSSNNVIRNTTNKHHYLVTSTRFANHKDRIIVLENDPLLQLFVIGTIFDSIAQDVGSGSDINLYQTGPCLQSKVCSMNISCAKFAAHSYAEPNHNSDKSYIVQTSILKAQGESEQIWNYFGDNMFDNLNITNGHITSQAALYAIDYPSNASVKYCNFFNNSAYKIIIYYWGSSSPKLNSYCNIISNNASYSTYDNAVIMAHDGPVTVSKSIITDNKAAYLFYSYEKATILVTKTYINHNNYLNETTSSNRGKSISIERGITYFKISFNETLDNENCQIECSIKAKLMKCSKPKDANRNFIILAIEETVS